MTGSLQEKNGIYQVVLHYKDSTGKSRYKWVSTGLHVRGNKRNAQNMINSLIDQYSYLEQKNQTNPLFTDFLLKWLEGRKGNVDDTTWKGYQTYVTRHVIPYFQSLNLTVRDVTPRHIKDYSILKLQNGRLDGKEGGLSKESIKKHRTVMSLALNDAVTDGLINLNPVRQSPMPRSKYDAQDQGEDSRVYLTADEANSLLQAFRGHALQPLVYITLYYGLRRSEVLGLKWDAVDFKKNSISIRHTVVKMLTIHAKDKTKSGASRRTYELLPELKEMLLHLKEDEELNRLIYGADYIDNSYIFKWPNGKVYRPDYITRKFQSILAQHNIPPMRFHDLRHSTASILYDKEWPLKDIQTWLGHSKIEVTANIYTHIYKQRNKSMAHDLKDTFHL